MQFKPPGGELTFWSALWVLFGALCLVMATMQGLKLFYLLGTAVGLMALGMWFEQRWCGYTLAVIFALSLPLALIALFMIDVTWSARAYRMARMAASVYFTWISFRWAQEG